MIRDITKKWCETGQLTLEDCSEILIEYCKRYGNRTIPPDLLQLFLGPLCNNIQWADLLKRLSINQNYSIIEIWEPLDSFGHYSLVMRKFEE